MRTDTLNGVSPIDFAKQIFGDKSTKTDNTTKAEKTNFADENEMVEFSPADETKDTVSDKIRNLQKILKQIKATIPVQQKTDILAQTIQKHVNSYDKTQDGKITGSKQGDLGDCWLLSGVNALSYSKMGAQYIKDVLEYTNDGTMVHFKNAGDYFVSNDTIKALKKNVPEWYSSGDTDMLAIEYAMAKLKNDIEGNGELTYDTEELNCYYPSASTYNMFDHEENNFLSIDGGYEQEAMYFMTGKIPTILVNLTDDEKELLLDGFQHDNSKTLAMTCASNKDIILETSDGEDYLFYSAHAYAIKKVDDKNVTLINPYNANEEVKITRESFKKVSEYTLLDMANTPDKDIISTATVKTETLSNGDIITTKKDDEGKTVREEVTDKDNKKQTLTYTNYDPIYGKTEVMHVYDNNEEPVIETTRQYSDLEGNKPAYFTSESLKDGMPISTTKFEYDNFGKLACVIDTEYPRDDKGDYETETKIYNYTK